MLSITRSFKVSPIRRAFSAFTSPTPPAFGAGRSQLQRSIHRGAKPKPPVAFTFDIDGVLLRGHHPIPGVHEVMRILEGENELGVKIPFIVLTNGGGTTEEQRASDLTAKLGTHIKTSQVVQAHTVLKPLAREYKDKPILVLGGIGDSVRQVAKSYGFDAYTPFDILAWNEAVSPLHRLSEKERSTIRHADFSTTPIHAVVAFHDPRNWFLDTQIACDVLRGVYLDSLIWRRMQQDHGPKPVELIFCNPDLIWGADFRYPRLGQGGFITAFQSVYEAQFGERYPFKQYGKPYKATYDFAKSVLLGQLADIEQTNTKVELPPIYMIGDNPESDIAGANGAGWKSILVHTGVYDPNSGAPPKHLPTYQAKDVGEAVRLALRQEMDKAPA